MADDVTGLPHVPPAEVLRGILEREDITILFQPIFDLRTGEPHGFEAFSRGPEQTALADYASLYHVANSADLLLELDRTCRRGAMLAARHLPANLNLFVKMYHIADESFCGKELIFLLEDGLASAQIVWQVSENNPIEKPSRFKDALTDLTELGCMIAVDNFGRGYAGLDKIVHIRPHYIKIAKELISEIHASSIKQQMLSTFSVLAKNIDAQLIATGIERVEELGVVRRIGVNLVQGYLLGKPSRGFQTVPSVEL